MSTLLDSLCVEENWRGHTWMDSWVCGGSPLRDPACELLFKQGLPAFRKALMVNWGSGAWMNLLDSRHGCVDVLHCYREDEILFQLNRERLAEKRARGLVWLPGDAWPTEWHDVDLILVRMWKEMDYNMAWMGALCANRPKDCAIHFIGQKEDGIRNLENRLEPFGRVDTLAVGCHSRWIGLENPVAPDTLDFPRVDSGLFGAGRMDGGTRLLLENAGSVRGMSVCDLGCGSGEIADWALRSGARRVVATDHQYQAVTAVRARFAGHVDRCRVDCSFIGEEIGESFDVVLTNPPFHLQGQTRLAIGQVWLRAAKNMLAPGGHVFLVCNEFLDYPRFAKDNGLRSRELAHKQGFRVYDFSV